MGICLSREKALTIAVIRKNNSETTAAVIKHYMGSSQNADFQKFAAAQTESIMKRHEEDDQKLRFQVDFAIEKGLLKSSPQMSLCPAAEVKVIGKSADAIADEIVVALGDASSKGCVICFQGSPGTGKSTTVSKLKEKVPKAQIWSNDNLFRSLTLLALTKAEKDKTALKDQLTAKALESFMGMLSVDNFTGNTGDRFGLRIEGLGLKYFISLAETTVLMEKRISENMSSVAEVAQGEVVTFAQAALDKMAAAGVNVLLEDSMRIVNYIRQGRNSSLGLDVEASTFCFNLGFNDVNYEEDKSEIGMRHAALLMSGHAKQLLEGKDDKAEGVTSEVDKALITALEEVTKPKATK